MSERKQICIENHKKRCFLFCSNGIKVDRAIRTRLNQFEMTSTILKEKHKYAGKAVTTEIMTMLFLMSNVDLLLNLEDEYLACLLQILANINVYNDIRKTLNIWLTGKSSIGKTVLAKLIHEFSTFHGYSQFQTLYKSARFYAASKNDFDYSFYIYPEAESQLMDPKIDMDQEILEFMHSDVWRYNVVPFYDGERKSIYREHHNRCCFLFCSNRSNKTDGEARTRLNQLEMTSAREKSRRSSK